MDSASLELVLGKMVSIVENEFLLLCGVRDEIKAIKLELKTMSDFLEDAKSEGEDNKREKAWVSSVRNMTCEIEIVIDEYMYHLNKQHQWRGKFARYFLRGIQSPQNLWFRHKVAVKLKDINQRITSIAERNKRYRLYQSEEKDVNRRDRKPPDWLRNHNESALFHKEYNLVGIKSAQNQLLELLLNDEPQVSVIYVVGRGGLGKTTLVANTFNKVKEDFDCCAWVTVSQQYAVQELFKSMIKELFKKEKKETAMELSNMEYGDLVYTLDYFLQTRRYLIVLDDVWGTYFWDDISTALPNNMNGSRVLITTRNEGTTASEFGVASSVFFLKPLTPDDSLTLFCMKAFASKVDQCPQYLLSPARRLVAKCEGLPLAILALGGLMAKKKSIQEWDRVSENLSGELSGNNKLERLKYISLLSYHDLPSPLKLCFLYCCIFPKDYPIKRKRLIRLWMAEGFVESSQDITPTVVAEQYLTELICRGLLQVVKRNESGRPKECKMHENLRELAISISKEGKFISKSDGKKEVEDEIRRLSVEVKEAEMEASKGISKLHSLFIFTVHDISRSSFKRLPSGLKLLGVLDLENAPIEELSDESVNLFNLRYLNLSGTQVKPLPKDIGKLHNLQYLILKRTKIKELPLGIVKLKHLLYLIAYHNNTTGSEFHYILGTTVPSNICLLKSLQALSFVQARGTFIKQISVMTQLRRLSITNVGEADEKNLCFAIGKMRLLNYLFVMSREEDEQLKMDALESPPPPYLEKLFLGGKLEKVPHWFSSLQSLTSLQLHWSRLREDFLPYIQALTNLGQLGLTNAYEGEQLNFIEGFQKLKILWIRNCPQLKGIVMNGGVMPGLQKLYILDCKEFVTLPHGWENLPHLKEVGLRYVSSELMEQIWKPQNGTEIQSSNWLDQLLILGGRWILGKLGIHLPLYINNRSNQLLHRTHTLQNDEVVFETALMTRNLEDAESETNWVVRPWW